MDSKCQRDQNSKGFEPSSLEQFSDFRVTESDELYEVSFLLPGFDKNDVSVALEDSEITVKASIDDSKPALAFGRKDYSRILEIPESCEKGKVTAKLDNGILKVVLPKRKPAKATEIKIS